MASVIQKAANGDRTALTMLLESNRQAVFCLSRALLRNSQIAASASALALTQALQSVRSGEVQTEEEFLAFAMKQAAGYCKKEALNTDAKAFKLPPQKDFHIPSINESRIGKHAGPLENYLNILPTLHRFIFVLRYVGNMSINSISICIGLEPSLIECVVEAESDNLSRVYRAVKSAGGQCTPPTAQLLKSAFSDYISAECVPEIVDNQVMDYIDSVAVPTDQKRKQQKVAAFIAAAAAGMLLLAYFMAASGQPSVSTEAVPSEPTETTTIETTAISETEYTEPFSIAPTETKRSETAAEYYADIEIQDYGTITVSLDAESAPITVENFISLAEGGFYDGLTFHRIIDGFMMQGGDPNGDGTSGSDKTIKGEFTDNGVQNTLSHTRGAISMARSSDYDSASSQFFIVHEDSTFLDGQYAVFGYVTDGMDIVDAICTDSEPTDNNGSIAAEKQPIITTIRIYTETPTSDIVAQVKEVRTDGSMLLYLYALEASAEEYEIIDYADVDLDNFAYAFDTMEYSLDEETTVKTAENGTLVQADIFSIAVGDMVIIYKDEEAKTDTIVVYQEHSLT